jgi:class 3 adenylate cyclase
MSAPENYNRPEFLPALPEALATGQRTLAAIVFTDTVGFSARMSKDEEETLRLVARDLEQMKVISAAFGGQVLKTTGDGLLMLFTSAVHAVACALEIQRDFQKKNLELPRAEQMLHRIGVHLGDVFLHGGDVMGDGVNIAARLQAQAVPGGICLSKTVYDVVNNRLPFYVNDLGARKLKNIGRVTAYQISPMEAGPGQRMAWYRWRPWIWRAAALLAIFVCVAIAFESGEEYRHQVSLRAHHAALAAGPGVSFTPGPAISSVVIQIRVHRSG